MWTRKMNFPLLISGSCITVMQKNSIILLVVCHFGYIWLCRWLNWCHLRFVRATPTWVPSQAKVLSPAHNGSTFFLKSISWAATHAQKTGHECVSWKKWMAWRFVCCIIAVHIPTVRCTWHLTRGNTTYKISAPTPDIGLRKTHGLPCLCMIWHTVQSSTCTSQPCTSELPTKATFVTW